MRAELGVAVAFRMSVQIFQPQQPLFFLIPVVLVIGLSYLFLRLDLLVVQFAAMSLSFCGHYYLDNQYHVAGSYRLEGRGYPLICARIRRLCLGVFPRRTSGRERLSGHPSCASATAPRYRTAGIAGSLGTGEIADMAVMGEGRRH
jgi:hypothetical protein